MKYGKHSFKTNFWNILRVLSKCIAMVILGGTVAMNTTFAEQAKNQKTAKKDIEYHLTYEITPDTIIPDMFPPNCTENVTVLDGVLISCSIPAPIDELKVAEEKEGGYTDISSYSLEELLIDDEYVRIVPIEIFYHDSNVNNVKIYIARGDELRRFVPIPYSFFKDRIYLYLNIVGNGGFFLFKIAELSPGMQKINNEKISLAKFSPDYAISYQQDTKIIYEVFFMWLSQIKVDGKAYVIYSSQLDSFYFFHDKRNIIQEYFSTLSSLFV